MVARLAVLSVIVSGIVTAPVSASDKDTVTVTEVPSFTGFGAADSVTFGRPSSSRMVTCTEVVVPARTVAGRVPKLTVNVSSSSSVSWFVAIVPVPVVEPALTVMLVSVPISPDSAVFGVAVAIDTGIVTALAGADDRVAVTVTDVPSSTGFGAAESDTVGFGVPEPVT